MPEVNGNKVQFLEAIRAAESLNVVLPEVYYGELQGIAQQLAFSIAGVASFDQLQAAKDSLTKALAEGQTFAQWQKNIDVKALGLSQNRLDTIFRTNIQSQYMAGKWQQFEQNQSRRPYLMYDAINDARVRPSHLAMDNIIRPINDPFWATHSPPCGFRCRCNLISLTEKQAQVRSANEKGLNKPVVPEKMQPDKGWDFSPRDRLAGIQAAIDKRLQVQNPLTQALHEVLRFNKLPKVSQSFLLPDDKELKGVAITTLDAINNVHRIENLPVIPIKAFELDKLGGYGIDNAGNPVEIAINPDYNWKELTLAHEIGHFIDHQALGKSGIYASKSSLPLLKKWSDAIENSKATELLRSGLSEHGTIGQLNYWLSSNEQWARSYAQYIAEKTQNKTMLSQIKEISEFDGWYRYIHWESDDFKAISLEIDEVFKKLGWLK